MRSRSNPAFVAAIILVALAAFVVIAFYLDVDQQVGGKFSVWERVGVLGLALLVFAPFVVYRARSGRGGFLATLLGTALWLPWIGAIASSALYLANIEGNPFWRDNALLIGISIAGAVWLFHALVDTDYATAERQSPGWYGLLRGEIGALRRELDGRSEPRVGTTGEAVQQQVRGQLEQVEDELRQTGVQWVTRSGFNAAWTHYHLAAETWIEASPTPSVVALAIGDIMRLDKSEISRGPDLQIDLWRAVTDLDPQLAPYVEALLPADVVLRIKSETPKPPDTTAAAAAAAPQSSSKPNSGSPLERIRAGLASATKSSDAIHDAASGTTTSIEQERRARAVIKSIHNAVNGYRGSRWAELARARWQLVQTTTIAGAFSLLVLGLALIGRVQVTNLVAGWAYFLVGAVAGLFLRLRQASEEEHVADDYGLETARLNQTPLLSGMAAVIGVVLMASLAGSTLGDVLTPPSASQSPAPTASAAATASPVATAEPSPSPSAAPAPTATPSPSEAMSTTADLDTAFDLGRYPVGLVIALIFGLTPNLVLQRLGVAAKAKAELVATRTTA